MRFLIADDSDFLRVRLIEMISEIEGAVVVGQAGDLDSIVQAVDHLNPDVVILDIRLPGGNGFAVLEKIKNRAKSPRVIMFTNYPYLQYRKKSMDLGADYFFYKATEFEKLIQLIKDLAQPRVKARR